MAPHDYRRLLLAHRDAGPAFAPAPGATARTPGMADAPRAAPDQPGPGAVFASEPAGPRATPDPRATA